MEFSFPNSSFHVFHSQVVHFDKVSIDKETGEPISRFKVYEFERRDGQDSFPAPVYYSRPYMIKLRGIDPSKYDLKFTAGGVYAKLVS
jgi:hypothetical protein